MKGKFITVEGVEGVGKSTNITFILQHLTGAGIDVLQTREPGGTPLAEEVRRMLLENRDETVDPTAELLLMFAARAQHLNTVILPALKKGTWVLCDRFTDATFAYQGAGRGLSCDVISQLENLVQGGVQPDLTFLLDLDVEIGLQRARMRADFDRFENEKIGFFERVREGYKLRVNASPERYRIIDASKELCDVQADIQCKLSEYIRNAYTI